MAGWLWQVHTSTTHGDDALAPKAPPAGDRDELPPEWAAGEAQLRRCLERVMTGPTTLVGVLANGCEELSEGQGSAQTAAIDALRSAAAARCGPVTANDRERAQPTPHTHVGGGVRRLHLENLDRLVCAAMAHGPGPGTTFPRPTVDHRTAAAPGIPAVARAGRTVSQPGGLRGGGRPGAAHVVRPRCGQSRRARECHRGLAAASAQSVSPVRDRVAGGGKPYDGLRFGAW